jgi:hypothetical protein
MGMDDHLMLVRFVDDRLVNLRCHLRVCAASIIHPDLDILDLLVGHRLNSDPCLLRVRDFVHHV